jgi:hypothetical protein
MAMAGLGRNKAPVTAVVEEGKADPGQVAADLVAESPFYSQKKPPVRAGIFPAPDLRPIGPSPVQGIFPLPPVFPGLYQGPHGLSPRTIGPEGAFNNPVLPSLPKTPGRFPENFRSKFSGRRRKTRQGGTGIAPPGKGFVFFHKKPLLLLPGKVIQGLLGSREKNEPPGLIVKPVEDAPLPFSAPPQFPNLREKAGAPVQEVHLFPRSERFIYGDRVYEGGLINHHIGPGFGQKTGFFRGILGILSIPLDKGGP